MNRTALRRPLVLFACLLPAALPPARAARPAPHSEEEARGGAAEFPSELVRFKPYAGNPVFAGEGPGHWDERIRERGWIMKEDGLYKMWFTGYVPGGPMMLGYATSPDGLQWTRYAGNPIYRKHWVEDMMIVKREGTYYMFAEGLHDRAQWLSSTNGIDWTWQGQLDIRRTDGRPIEPGPYGTPTAWREDGLWRLFYERSDLGVWLARSKDLKTWTNVRDEPVIPLGPDAYDREQIALNQIVKYQGRYYAYYHGSGPGFTPRRWCTAVAVSTDLIHWKKYPGNPLLPMSENKSSGILVYDGKQFRLYTMHDQVCVHFPAAEETTLFDGERLGKWQVIETVDFRRHGRVRVEDGRLVLEAGRPFTGVRWTGEFPRDNYEVTLEAMRVAGDDFFCGMTFPIGPRALTLIVGGWGGRVVGLSSINGEPAVENETCRYEKFERGRWYRIRLRATRPRIEVWIDDEKVVDLETEGRELTIYEELQPCRPLGIVTWRTSGALRDIRVRSLAAPAKQKARDPEPPALGPEP